MRARAHLCELANDNLPAIRQHRGAPKSECESKKHPRRTVGSNVDKTDDRLRGFTLLELLVVLVIIGIVIGSVGLSVDTGPELAATEAKRLAALLQLAREEAVLSGNEYAAEFTARDYLFQQWQQDRWQPAADDVFRRRRLPDELHLSLRLPEDPTTSELALDNGGEAPARIYLLSSGEVTPFELILIAGADRPLYRIAGGTRGEIALEPVATD